MQRPTVRLGAALLIGICLLSNGIAAEPAPGPSSGNKGKVDQYGDPLPPGALARLGTVRYRFSSMATAFLPDGKTVVSAQQGGGIHLWDPRTGRLVREINTGHFQASGTGMGGFTLSRDGKRLAVGGSVHDDGVPSWRSAAAVFDLSSGKAIRVIERPPLEGVHGLTLSPDGKLLFTLGRQGKLRVEEVDTGAELLTQQFPGDVMAHLTLSPDGSTLALGSGPNSHKIFLWRWQAAGEPRELPSGNHRGREVIFSPDGKLLAECSDLEPDIRIMDVASGKLLHTLETPDREPFRYFHLAFAPNGKLLAASGSSNNQFAVNLWEPVTGKFVKRLALSGALAFSPDSTLLIAASRVWDLAHDKELSPNDEAHRGPVSRIVTGSKDVVVTAGDDSTIRVWDAATGKQRHCLVSDNSSDTWIGAIALSSDGTRLVSSIMSDKGVYLWDMATGKRIYRLAGHGRLGSVAGAAMFLSDGKSFLDWGAADMCLRKWDIRTGKALAEHIIRPEGIPVPSEDDEPMARDRRMMLMFVSGARFTPDAKWLVFQAGTKWYVFDTTSGKSLHSFPREGNMLIGSDISPDGKLVLASGYGKSIQTKLPGGGMQMSTPKNHPITLWDLTTGEVRKQITLPEETPGPVAFSPDGKWFAVASSRPGTQIRLMETATGRELQKIEGFRGTVRSLAFLADGKRLVSGMEDTSALIWELKQDR